MKALIVYASNHGCAEKSAYRLRELLDCDTRIVNLRQEAEPDLSEVDTVIVGGSIHAGRVQKAVRKFTVRHEEKLLTKKLGLYLCCMYEGKKASKQLEDNFGVSIRSHASATGLFGGVFDFDKMGFFEKAIVRKVAGVKESVSKLDDAAVAAFAEKMRATD